MINKKDIVHWLLGNFAVSNSSHNELRFPCPYCGYDNFYFNIDKNVGYCHKAKCHKKPSLDDLIYLIGYSPEMAGYIPSIDNAKAKGPVEVAIPKGCWSILERNDTWAIDCLLNRGVELSDIAEFDIQADDISIVIPVHEGGTLLNYVRRFVDRSEPAENGFTKGSAKRYRYCHGVKTTDFLFNWDIASQWDTLTLVENTFNAIWLKDLQITTNFGSYLSNKQCKQILRSKCKKVNILWDEGANYTRPTRTLQALGIPAQEIIIKGQPDNYSKKEIKELIYA